MDLGRPVRNGSFWEIDGASLPPTGAVRVRGIGHETQRMGEAHLSLGSEPPAAVLSSLAGVAVSEPVEMGSVIPGDEQTKEFLIRNLSSRSIRGVSISFSGTDAAMFTIDGQSHETLEAYGEIKMQVRFSPSSIGFKTSILTVSGLAPSFQTISVPVQGHGIVQYEPVMEEAGVVPFTTTDFDARPYTLGSVIFNYPPNGGSTYRILESTGTASIGAFSNAPAGSRVTGIYQKHSYEFDVIYINSGSIRAVDIRMVNTLKMVPSYSAQLGAYGGALAIQADGRMIVSGAFQTVNGVSRSKLARLMPSGALDLSFNGSTNLGAENILPLDDGKILIGGNFTTAGGQPRVGIARLHSDGSLDPLFDLGLNGASIRLLALLGGKVLVGGSFTTAKGLPRVGLVRLLPDGAVDETFDVKVFDEVPVIFSLAAQEDGQILIGGTMKIAGEIKNLIRISSDGKLDESFQPQPDAAVSALVIQKNGQILAGGHFSMIGGQVRSRIARLNPDGTSDRSFAQFNQINQGISCIAVQKDGRIIVSGVFRTANTLDRAGVARLHPDGELDASFNTGSFNNGSLFSPFIWAVLLAEDGSIFVSGEFTGFAGLARTGLVKLASSGTSDFNVLNGSDLVWQQSGSAPELASVSFEFSPDGGIWTPLGKSVESADGWKLDAAVLPTAGFIRASGRELVSNRGFATIQKLKLTGRQETALENWRVAQFGSPLNEGVGRDAADGDADGLANLMEYGFGLDPKRDSSGKLPVWGQVVDGYEVGFQKPVGVEGIGYDAEWSETLDAGDWNPAENIGDGDWKAFRVPVGAQPKLFFRLKVTNP